jgi:phage FluMu protein Com
MIKMRQIRCPKCNKRILDADIVLGAKIKCTRCHYVFIVDDAEFLIKKIKTIILLLTKK